MKNSFTAIRLFPLHPFRHTQLAGMMFIQFVMMGCTNPIMSLYMKDYMHFSGLQIGSTLSFSVIACFFSPIICSIVADRIIASERFLSIIHILSAALMYTLLQQTSFVPFLIVYILYTAVFNPAGALANAICFHHLHDRNIFGDIRLWGTIGWIAAAWIFGAIVSSGHNSFLSNNLRGALELSIIASLILSVYLLFIPSGIKQAKTESSDCKPKSLNSQLNPFSFFRQMYRNKILSRNFLALSLFSCFITLVDRFYVFGAAPFIKSIGYNENDILSILSIGQIPEIFILLVLGSIIKKTGFKAAIMAGIGLEALRFGLFASYHSDIFLFSGILLHGISWALFFVPITIYIDQQSTAETRVASQQLYTFIYGNGAIAGNVLSGLCLDLSKSSGESINYTLFWLIPTALSILFLVVFPFCFKEEKSIHRQNQ